MQQRTQKDELMRFHGNSVMLYISCVYFDVVYTVRVCVCMCIYIYIYIVCIAETVCVCCAVRTQFVCVRVCFLWISEQTAFISEYIN